MYNSLACVNSFTSHGKLPLFNILPAVKQRQARLQAEFDRNPQLPSRLGTLAQLAVRIGVIQNSLKPCLHRPTLMICAADHGAFSKHVDSVPAEDTRQQLQYTLAGTAPINRIARANGLELLVVDAGVSEILPEYPQLYNARIAAGTANYVRQPAMSREQCLQALYNGTILVDSLSQQGCNIVGFGSIGAGNSGSAALLMSTLCYLPIERCIGHGDGGDTVSAYFNIRTLQYARQRLSTSQAIRDPIQLLSEFGGFEIVTVCGSMLRAAERGMVIVVDGFASTAALLAARALNPHVVDYCIASHRSAEPGHSLMLQQLRARPLLELELEASGGLGVALAYPLINSAVALLSDVTH